MSKGRQLNPVEQWHVDGAIAMLKQWEAGCWLQGTPYPEIPAENPGGEDTKGSDAAENTTIGGETADFGEKEVPAATSCPAAGPGSQTFPSGTVWTTTGGPDAMNINTDMLAKNMLKGDAGRLETAATIVHEAHHLYGPNQSDGGSFCDNEQETYHFMMEWWCAVANCTSANDYKGLADMNIEFMKEKLEENGCALPEEECDTGFEEQESPQTPSPPLNSFHAKSSRGHFVTGPDDFGSGFIKVNPAANQIYIRAVVGDVPQRFSFDMGALIPGFQITCIDLPSAHSTGTVAIGGYDVTTGEGMLVRGVIDLSQVPGMACTVEYKGVDFGAPFDIYSHKSKPGQVLVLDAGSYSVLACNLVSDTCVVLATPTQAPELIYTRELTAARSEELGQPTQYLTYIATSGSALNAINPSSENTDIQVHLTDIGGDLIIDHIITK